MSPSMSCPSRGATRIRTWDLILRLSPSGALRFSALPLSYRAGLMPVRPRTGTSFKSAYAGQRRRVLILLPIQHRAPDRTRTGNHMPAALPLSYGGQVRGVSAGIDSG